MKRLTYTVEPLRRSPEDLALEEVVALARAPLPPDPQPEPEPDAE